MAKRKSSEVFECREFGVRNETCRTYSIPLIADDVAEYNAGLHGRRYPVRTFLPRKAQLRKALSCESDDVWRRENGQLVCGRERDIHVITETTLGFLMRKVAVFRHLVKEGVFTIFSVDSRGRVRKVAKPLNLFG